MEMDKPGCPIPDKVAFLMRACEAGVGSGRDVMDPRLENLFYSVRSCGKRSKPPITYEPFACTPPLQHFVPGFPAPPSAKQQDGITPAEFLSMVAPGDICYGSVTRITPDTLYLTVKAVSRWDSTDQTLIRPSWGEIGGLKIQAELPFEEVEIQSNQGFDGIDHGDTYRCVVLGSQDRTLRVSCRSRRLPSEAVRRAVALGGCPKFAFGKDPREPDFRPLRQLWWEGMRDDRIQAEGTYLEQLQRDEAFANPYAVDQMVESLQVDQGGSNLMDFGSLKKSYIELRQDQHEAYSHDHVVRGVECTRNGEYKEAIRHFERALSFNKNNVDAYVGRGAARANRQDYQGATADFEKALSIDPNHPNAAKYLAALRKKIAESSPLSESEREAKEERDPSDSRVKAIAAQLQNISKKGGTQAPTGHYAAQPLTYKQRVHHRNNERNMATANRITHERMEGVTQKLIEILKQDSGRDKKKRKEKKKKKSKKKSKKGKKRASSSSDSDSGS
eukprot:Sspe_Gene.6988::Locus_2340_Transcript_1_1_Confidence_1.000_Length_1598::g.6988::m.6988